MSVVHSDLQAASPSSIIELFELELFQSIHGASEVWRFHAGSNANSPNGSLVWNGNTYTAFPVEATGFEYTGTGQLPRPTFRVSNVLGTVTAILLSTPRGLEGAKLTRIRTLARYIDAANFPARRNLFTNTEALNLSPWEHITMLPYGSGSVVDATYAPDGTLTAELLTEDNTFGAHGTGSRGFIIGQDHVASIHAKEAPGAKRYLTITVGGSPVFVTFDLETGAYLTASVPPVAGEAGAVKLDNGWWRCWVRATPTSSGVTRFRLNNSFRVSGLSYTGDNTSGMYMWGGQLELGNTLTDYQPVGTTWTGNPYGTPNPAAEFPREVYYIDRKVNENPAFVEFELATAFDLAGVRVPKRQALANLCAWQYRSADCGYTGALPTCVKSLDDCRAHFGESAPLPFGAFPGVGSYYT